MLHDIKPFALLIVLWVIVGAYTSPHAHAEETTARPFQVYLPTVVQAGDASLASVQDVLTLTNQLRQQYGCDPLTLSPELSAAATAHSADMATNNYMSHTGSDGSSPSKRITQAGYVFTMAAENVAAGYATPESVVNGWFNETPPNDGHRRNILNCALKEIGIGQAYNKNSTYHYYWTQDFGTR